MSAARQAAVDATPGIFEFQGLRCPIGKSNFVPTPVVSGAGHARSLEDTYAWVRPLLRKVPVTRVNDVTPLDFTGLPVWSAVTPLAKDLTVHAGKGASSLAAKLSAIMEAIERVCGESIPDPDKRILRAPFAELRKCAVPVVNPEALGLPFDTNYTPDRVIRWTLGYDLMRDEHLWVPVDFVVTPAEEGVCSGVETNGLASGNTITEAVVHALYELIERDALALDLFCELYAEATDPQAAQVRIIDPAGLPKDTRLWIDQLIDKDIQVVVQDLSGDLRVPVFGVCLIDPWFPGNEGSPMLFGGYGCDLSPRRAVFRAVTEAVQSHSIISLGARDTFEGMRPLPDRVARLRRRLDVSHPRNYHPFPDETVDAGDLWLDLQEILRRLKGVELERCVVVSLTREDLKVPVVRVLVPGLEGPYGSTTRRPGGRLLRSLVCKAK